METSASQNLASQYRDSEKQLATLMTQLLNTDNERHNIHKKISELYVYQLPGMGDIFNSSVFPEIVDHETYQKLNKDFADIQEEYLDLVNLCNDAFAEFRQMQRSTGIHDLTEAYTLVNW